MASKVIAEHNFAVLIAAVFAFCPPTGARFAGGGGDRANDHRVADLFLRQACHLFETQLARTG